MTLEESGSKSITDIEVYPAFEEVLEDFAEFLPPNDETIMDDAIRNFTAGLSSIEGTTDASYIKKDELEYRVSFGFDNISNMLAELGHVDDQSVIRETEHGLRFYLDIDNYPELKNAIPFLADPNFEVYGPEFNQGLTEEEYLEMIYYLVEDGDVALMNSVITVDVNTPKPIKSINGAAKTGAKSFRYQFPLLDFLLLAEPMQFSVTW